MSNPKQAQGTATQQRRARWLWQAPRGQSLRIAPRLPRLELLIALASLAPLVTACRPEATGNASPSRTLSDGSFRWTLTRLEGATPETQVGWLDNDTVLFIGSNDSTDGSPEIRGLYAWNRKSPARLVLANAYQFCFDGKTWTARTGEPQPGREDLLYRRYQINPNDLTATWIGPDRAGTSTGYPNPYTCRDEKRPVQLEDHYWSALRPQDGYLDFGAVETRNQNTHLVSRDLKTRSSLGFKTEESSGKRTRYSRHLGAYIVYDFIFAPDTLAAWNQDKRFTIHSISPKGNALAIDISPGPWSEELGGDRSIEPTKIGIAISSKAGRTSKNTESGLYLIKSNKKFIKLDNASIGNIEASPKGCRLAYTQTTKENETNLKTADLCLSTPDSNETNQHPAT